MTAAVATDLSTGTWAIDPVHSSIGFSVRHLVVSKVRGNFETFSGAIVVAEDGTPSVNAEIGVDSLSTGNEQRDGHVKSADFFDAEKYPTATFVSTGVRADGDDYVLDGDFTLKGVTKPIELKLAFNGTNPGMGHGEVAGFELIDHFFQLLQAGFERLHRLAGNCRGCRLARLRVCRVFRHRLILTGVCGATRSKESRSKTGA